MKLIIMGAGYVGMALLSALQNGDHELYITTTQESRIHELKQYGEEVLALSGEYEQKLKEWIDSSEGMVILVAPSQGKSYEETYLNTAKRISSALKERVKPFYVLYTSSTSVCEGTANEWVTENTPLNPLSQNGKILLETEGIYLNSEATACILRLGGIYGPNRQLTERARRLSGKEMAGDGSEPTNNIHLDDIVRGIQFCIEHSLKGVYHLVNDDHPTRKELYLKLCAQMGLPSPVWNGDRERLGYKISNEKIKKAGFVFKHSKIDFP